MFGAVLAVVWFAALHIATPEPLSAQAHRITNPVDSYLWWTLSEEVTPRELKRLYSDRALSLARYQQAVEAGLEQPLTEDELQRLTFYINHQLTPELAPMWWAFDIFARTWVVPKPGPPEEHFVEQMTGYGISRGGVDNILVAVHGCAADHGALMADLGPKQAQALRLLRGRFQKEREGKTTGKPIMESVNARRYDVVAAETGRNVDEVRELVDALAEWEAGSRLVAACLPELKVQLSEEDWQQFRAYLRERVIAPLGGMPFFKAVAGEDSP